MELLLAYILVSGPVLGALLAFFINRAEKRALKLHAGDIAWALEMNRINTGD